ncbi:lipopolysaccharide biosynthesis protein [Paenibacillus ihuae]|uniref:lipopolysaccharide biosynthesis protein n=1 Tax=Paenibacillus ihuae TaxID=1232431 RepID=UPI001FD75176|nr:polysaccharide biosynthesis C-terminal domain-containing protein [Paenibacillus ihuae]
MTGKDSELIIATVGRAFRTSMFIMTIILIPSMFIGRYLLGLLFGSQFLEESSSFYLLSMECIVSGGTLILSSSFIAIARAGSVIFRQLVGIIVTISLFFLLAPLLGLFGVALALLTGGLVRLIITLFQLPRVFNVPLKSILYDRNDFKYMNSVIKERFLRKGVSVSANHKQ